MTLEEEIEFLVWMPKNIFWKKKNYCLKKTMSAPVPAAVFKTSFTTSDATKKLYKTESE